MLLLAALSEGTTVVENLLDSADINFMLGALKQLKVGLTDDKATKSATVVGNGGPINQSEELFLGKRGSPTPVQRLPAT